MQNNTAPVCDGKTLKILAITSSFGLNTTQYLYDIAEAEGCTDIVVARLYGSGCTLAKHLDNAREGHKYYEYTKNTSGVWSIQKETPFLEGLLDEPWDIIYLQQSADRAPFADTFGDEKDDYIDALIQFIRQHIPNPNLRFVWNMTWAFQKDCVRDTFERLGNDQLRMYNCIVDALQQHIPNRKEFEVIIPTGTAIQNVRTSFIGDNLTKDGLHLNRMGYAVAGYTAFCSLTGQKMTDFRMTAASTYTQEKNPLVLSEREKLAITEAVNAALENPYQITNSTYID